MKHKDLPHPKTWISIKLILACLVFFFSWHFFACERLRQKFQFWALFLAQLLTCKSRWPLNCKLWQQKRKFLLPTNTFGKKRRRKFKFVNLTPFSMRYFAHFYRNASADGIILLFAQWNFLFIIFKSITWTQKYFFSTVSNFLLL